MGKLSFSRDRFENLYQLSLIAISFCFVCCALFLLLQPGNSDVPMTFAVFSFFGLCMLVGVQVKLMRGALLKRSYLDSPVRRRRHGSFTFGDFIAVFGALSAIALILLAVTRQTTEIVYVSCLTALYSLGTIFYLVIRVGGLSGKWQTYAAAREGLIEFYEHNWSIYDWSDVESAELIFLFDQPMIFVKLTGDPCARSSPPPPQLSKLLKYKRWQQMQLRQRTKNRERSEVDLVISTTRSKEGMAALWHGVNLAMSTPSAKHLLPSATEYGVDLAR